MKQNWRALFRALNWNVLITEAHLCPNFTITQRRSTRKQCSSVGATCRLSTQVHSSSSVPCQTSARAIIVSWSCDQAATRYWTTSGPIRRSHKQMRGGGSEGNICGCFQLWNLLAVSPRCTERADVLCVDGWKQHGYITNRHLMACWTHRAWTEPPHSETSSVGSAASRFYTAKCSEDCLTTRDSNLKTRTTQLIIC